MLSRRDSDFRAFLLMRSLGQLLVPADPTVTFAREVPVPRIGTSSHKYKRFQRFGWTYGQLPLTGLRPGNAKPTC
jgi:hypothetical protein